MSYGSNSKSTNSYNIRIVIETIRLHGPLSRAEIARQTNLTKQTLTNISKKLLKLGIIYEAEKKQEGIGAPSVMIGLDKNAAFSIGIDFDNDHITGILVDLFGNRRQQLDIDLDSDIPSYLHALELIEETVAKLLKKQEISEDKVVGLGISLPGPLKISNGKIIKNKVNPSFIQDWTEIPIVTVLKERLKLPVFIENNATAAAIGERWYGSGQDINTFFFVYLAAGLGGGLIINNYPYSGSTGNAGELGYYFASQHSNNDINHVGELFNLPRLFKMLEKHDIHITKATHLEQLYYQDNPVFEQWMNSAASELAPLLLGIEYMLDPDVIFLGGRMPSVIINSFIERVNKLLPSMRIEGKNTFPEIKNATSGYDAACLGVASIPLYKSLDPNSDFRIQDSDSCLKSLFH